MTETERTTYTSEDARAAISPLQPVIEANREAGEQQRRLPDPVVAAMRDAGLFSLWTPRVYGGQEVDLPTFMTMVEGLATLDSAVGWTFANLAAGAVLVAFLPPAGATEIYAAGPNGPITGSVIPRGQATPTDGGYVLRGRWPLASGSHQGDWLSGTSVVLDDGVPRTGPDGAPDLKVMFVRRDDAELLDTWHSVGLRGTGSTDFTVSDVFVPEQRVFSLFTAVPRIPGALYQLGIVPLYSMALSAVLLGVARAAVDAFVELAKEKTPTLSQTGLATRPTIHAEVARAEAQLQAVRAYLYTVAGDLMAVVRAGRPVADELEAQRRLACAHAGAVCPSVVNALFALAGTTPIYSGHRLERCLRDVRTAAQHMLFSPVWWEKTGQFYFGLGLGMP